MSVASAARVAAWVEDRDRAPRLRLVRPAGVTRPAAAAGPAPATHFAAAGARPGVRPQAGQVRLTRRGRTVVAALAMAVAVATVTLLWAIAGGGARAAAGGPAARGAAAGGAAAPSAYRGLTQVVVRPGQTLWSIAASADPQADPRIVVRQIIGANALSGTEIQAGQVLWIPKG